MKLTYCHIQARGNNFIPTYYYKLDRGPETSNSEKYYNLEERRSLLAAMSRYIITI